MLSIKVKQSPIGVHAVVPHAPTRTSACQVNDFTMGKIVELPPSLTEPDAIVHIFQIHKKAFIQNPDLFNYFFP
jgi:hypothetical protein